MRQNQICGMRRYNAVLGKTSSANDVDEHARACILSDLLLHLNIDLPDQRAELLRLNAAPGTARALARTVRDVVNWRGQTRYFLELAREAPFLPPIQLFWGESDRIIPIRHG